MSKYFTLLDLTKDDLKKIIKKYDKGKVKNMIDRSIFTLEKRLSTFDSIILDCNKKIEDNIKEINDYKERIKLTDNKIQRYRDILKEFFGE